MSTQVQGREYKQISDKYKLPAAIAHLSRPQIAELIRQGKADIAPFRDEQGRVVIVLQGQE